MRLTLDPSELTRCRMSTIIPKQISRPPAYNWIQRSRGSNKFCTIPGSASADRLQESHHHTCTAQTSKFGSSISLYLYTLTWCVTSPHIRRRAVLGRYVSLLKKIVSKTAGSVTPPLARSWTTQQRSGEWPNDWGHIFGRRHQNNFANIRGSSSVDHRQEGKCQGRPHVIG